MSKHGKRSPKSTDRPADTAVAQGSRRIAETRTVMRINRRLVVILSIVLVLSGACVHALHAFMVDRNAGDLRDRSIRAEEQGEIREAISLLSQYRQFRPDDLDATERLADLLSQESESPAVARQVAQMLEEVLRKDPARDHVRRPLIDACMRLGRFTDAEHHADAILAGEDVDDRAALIATKARARAGLGRFEQAIALFVASIELDPQSIEPYAELAALLIAEPASLPLRESVSTTASGEDSPAAFFPAKRGEIPAEGVADRVVDRMVSVAQPTWKALIARSTYHARRQNVVAAAEDAEAALEISDAKLDADAIMTVVAAEIAVAGDARSKGDSEEADRRMALARSYAEAGLASDLPEPRLHLALAQVELAGGTASENVDSALKLLRRGIEQAESLREDADGSSILELVESEVQLRWSLADLLVSSVESGLVTGTEAASRQAAAQAEFEPLRTLRCRPELLDFIETRLIAVNGNYARAATELEAVRLRMLGSRDLLRRIDLLLGHCYSRLQNPDRRIEVFRRAKAEDPLWSGGRVRLAEALAEAGRIDEALAEYGAVGNVPGVPEASARLVMLRELRKPPADRNLNAMETAVAAADRAAAGDGGAPVLRAELLVAQKQYAAAEALLEQATAAAPADQDVWQARLSLAARRQDKSEEERAATAEDLIAEAEQQNGDTVELRIAKAELARLKGPELLRESVRQLAADAEKFPAADRIRLYESLVRHAATTRNVEVQKSLWRKIVDLQPEYLPAWLAIAELSSESADRAGVEEAIAAIRKVEGPGGPNGNFAEAVWQLRQVASDEQLRSDPVRMEKALAGTRDLLQKASERRSYWAAIPRTLGLLESMIGNQDAAFQHYRRARNLGDLSPEVIRGLVEYYRTHRQFDLADAVIRDAEHENPGLLSGELGRLAWRVALERGQIDTALGWTERLAEDSSDFRDRVAHGHLLFAKYRMLPEAEQQSDEGQRLLKEARDVYRKVVDEVPQQPEAWFAYIVHLWRVEDKDAARAAIAEAEKALSAEPVHARLTALAQYYTVVEEPERAAESFRKAVDAAPENAELRRTVADYFSRTGDMVEANRHLEWLLDTDRAVPSHIAAWARQRRAFTTALARGRYEDVTRALEMLNGGTTGGSVSVADLRAQVALLSGRTSLRVRRQVIALYEEIRKQAELSDDEKLQLAALYEQAAEWPKGKALLQELAATQSTNPGLAAALIIGSVRHEERNAELLKRLRPEIDRLKALSPNSLVTALTLAEFHTQFEQPADAAKILRDFAASLGSAESLNGAEITAAELAAIKTLAQRAEELKLDVAEEFFRQVANASSHGQDSLLLAMYLGRRGVYGKGLEVVKACADRCTPEATAVAAVSIVSVGRPSPEHLATAEELVTKSLQAVPDSIRTLNVLGGLRLAQGRYDEAEAIYRQIIAEEPANLSALNNLAWVLVITGKNLGEAERLSNESIAIAGPLADLIDTRGMIHLARRRPDEAIKELQDAFADTPTPSMGFHLALAYEQLDRRAEARTALGEAHKIGLDIDQLHVTEHKAYQDLVLRLGADKTL